MKKRILSLLMILFVLVLSPVFAVSARAEGEFPDWYPEDVNNFEAFYNENAARVVDNADIFSDSEEQKLTEKINDFIKKTGKDFVIFTDTKTYGLERDAYARDFYRFNGYGMSPDHSGSVLFIEYGEKRGWDSEGDGSASSFFNAENVNDLDDDLMPYMQDRAFYDGAVKYIDDLSSIYENGFLPGGRGDTTPDNGRGALAGGGIAAAIAAIVAGLSNSSRKGKMKTIRTATSANNYYVKDSLNLRYSKDVFLYRDLVYTEVEREDKGGSSTHSGTTASDGGGSFSGGGRDF